MHRDSVVKYGWHDGMRDENMSNSIIIAAKHKTVTYVAAKALHKTVKPVNKVKAAKVRLAQVQPVHGLGITAHDYELAENMRQAIQRLRGDKDVVSVSFLGKRVSVPRSIAISLDNSDTIEKTR